MKLAQEIQKTLKELTFVDGPNPELALDGRNQGGTLEGGAGEGFEGMGYLGDIRDDDEVSQWRAVTVAAKGNRVTKTKLRQRRRECEENRTCILIFLNVASTSIFSTKSMLTKRCKR